MYSETESEANSVVMSFPLLDCARLDRAARVFASAVNLAFDATKKSMTKMNYWKSSATESGSGKHDKVEWGGDGSEKHDGVKWIESRKKKIGEEEIKKSVVSCRVMIALRYAHLLCHVMPHQRIYPAAGQQVSRKLSTRRSQRIQSPGSC